MAEVFETPNLHPIPRLPRVQVIDDFGAAVKINQVQIVFVAHRIDEADQVLVLLLGAIQITLLVYEPGNLGVRSELTAQLLCPYSRGANKVRPPRIWRINFIVLPLIKGRPADDDDPLFVRGGGGESTAAEHERQ